jgi:ribosomal protein RSM22 (predicted rRNA methylase)
LASAWERLSARLRSGQPTAPHDDDERCAYLLARLPATAAACHAALGHAVAAGVVVPATAVDLGSGPGAMAWALAARHPGIAVTGIEADRGLAAWAERLAAVAAASGGPLLRHRQERLENADLPASPLITASYSLNELTPVALAGLLPRLWAACTDTLVIVEPGTPAGASVIATVRRYLLGVGAVLRAPCTHHGTCPLEPGFAAAALPYCRSAIRLPRSRLHRHLKGAAAAYEDESYSYLVATRSGQPRGGARLVAPPQRHGHALTLVQCQTEGLWQRHLSPRDPDWRTAKRWDWGDWVG